MPISLNLTSEMKSCQTTESIISSHKINQHVLHYETEIVIRTKTVTAHYHIPENYPPTDYSKSRKRAPILIQRQECVYIITLTWKKTSRKGNIMRVTRRRVLDKNSRIFSTAKHFICSIFSGFILKCRNRPFRCDKPFSVYKI